MKEQLQRLLQNRVDGSVADHNESGCAKIEKKKEQCSTRSAEIIKTNGTGRLKTKQEDGYYTIFHYDVHMQYLIKQKSLIYMEEEIEHRRAVFYQDQLIEDEEMDYPVDEENPFPVMEEDVEYRSSYQYDRLKAAQYAEKWWNSYNPAYKKFEVDCTNFISQCLRAGGAPMRGYPGRGKGWWMQNSNWSYSWAVANSLRWYLSSSSSGLRAKKVGDPQELDIGDVICYDFQGDGRYDHNTIVTGKDANGMPLVNAHTYNSRMRYWAYEDSSAYTPNIQYSFFKVMDDR
ncbi:amidase domain-containing protein [Falsibacillus pallidus]|uniref:Putative amidase-like protein n=1 Tax=Falsibacillus pallidus TaxID=493781 RepID=A0A370GXQ7_9BACI|nr:amidase domain-containing protein [Falsibacillus pallidus]RDI48030.1 putative amidase-like protein [Falsibacillus pallidus]